MRLQKIGFENYKAFKLPQEIELRPLTILIGRNSSGKSAVSRLPLLLGRSLTGSNYSPLDIQFDDLDFGGSFVDLIHNRFSHGFLDFSLTFADEKETLELKIQIQNIADSPIQIIKHFSLSSAADNYKIELNWVLSEDVKGSQFYDLSGDQIKRVQVDFNGFIPTTLIDEVNKKYFSQIASAVNDINYLGPFRQFPERIYRHTGTATPEIGFKGKNAPQILGIDFYKEGQIVKAVGEWFKQNLGGWRLDVEKALNFFELVLVSPDDPEVKINIVDVGHGMSQVLPIVVMNFMPKGLRTTIEIIEQPELHLHPEAHGNLAELYVDTCLKQNSSFLIETHSENFVLRLRRLIASKKISKEMVVIYFVDDTQRPGSQLTKIEIDENGDVSYWPEGIFKEGLQEVVEMRKINRAKE